MTRSFAKNESSNRRIPQSQDERILFRLFRRPTNHHLHRASSVVWYSTSPPSSTELLRSRATLSISRVPPDRIRAAQHGQFLRTLGSPNLLPSLRDPSAPCVVPKRAHLDESRPPYFPRLPLFLVAKVPFSRRTVDRARPPSRLFRTISLP
jgi:hypothetical protein